MFVCFVCFSFLVPLIFYFGFLNFRLSVLRNSYLKRGERQKIIKSEVQGMRREETAKDEERWERMVCDDRKG